MATILIVDEPASSRQLTVLLDGCGHRILEAADGERALEIVRSENPDLVLADILVPGLGGYQFVQRLRAEPGLNQPRVVFLSSGYLEAEARVLAYVCGVFKLVTKPAEPGTLAAIINDALSEPRPPGESLRREPGPIDTHLNSIVSKLHARVEELEQINAQLDGLAAQYNEQLEVARSALQQEVMKRILAEKELTRANLRLHDKAMRDALTGLYNRGFLEESLDREESRAKRSDQPFGVLMIDIDHFKRCNDQFGHAAGDEVLRAVARFMLSQTRGEDILCRYGGEEFVLVMANALLGTVQDRAERIRLGVQSLDIECDGRSIGRITVSIGIAIFPDNGDSGPAVLRAADTALYRAKQAGRDCIVAMEKPAGALKKTRRTRR